MKNEVVKKTEHDKLVRKVNVIDTSGLVEKTKVNGIKGKIPSTTGLATTAALNAVKNKIPNVSDLVKKTGYDAKISDIESKYFITSD